MVDINKYSLYSINGGVEVDLKKNNDKFNEENDPINEYYDKLLKMDDVDEMIKYLDEECGVKDGDGDFYVPNSKRHLRIHVSKDKISVSDCIVYRGFEIDLTEAL